MVALPVTPAPPLASGPGPAGGLRGRDSRWGLVTAPYQPAAWEARPRAECSQWGPQAGLGEHRGNGTARCCCIWCRPGTPPRPPPACPRAQQVQGWLCGAELGRRFGRQCLKSPNVFLRRVHSLEGGTEPTAPPQPAALPPPGPVGRELCRPSEEGDPWSPETSCLVVALVTRGPQFSQVLHGSCTRSADEGGLSRSTRRASPRFLLAYLGTFPAKPEPVLRCIWALVQ